MTFTITLYWWVIPLVVTLCAVFWAIFIVDGGGGMFAGLENVFSLVPALLISLIAWIAAAIFK